MKFKGVVHGKNDSMASRTGNSNSGIAVEAHVGNRKVVVRLYDGQWEHPEDDGIPYCRIYVENTVKGTTSPVYTGSLANLARGKVEGI